MPNRLIDETSPYLLQHANNPVDWYPWGEEALGRARDEDRPILLSIGYSACHWCHVMERESFENDAIAEIMNRDFVNIKVDREERPDLDAVYMEAVQMLTGSGGWPMTVFLTPDCKPFYGGTYFPPVDRHNMPGFPRLLETVSHAYRNSHSEIQRVTNQLTEQMGRTANMPRGSGALDESILHNAYNQLATNFDYQNGGVGSAPKFPQAMTLEILLRYYAPRAQRSCSHDAGPDPRENGRAAAFTTRLAEASTGIQPTPSGWCLTSRRCCMTTPCWPVSTCMHGWPPGGRCTAGFARKRWTTFCGR